MTLQKGWFIRTKEPNTLFWTLNRTVNGDWTSDPEKALMFLRKEDADSFFDTSFHPATRAQFEVAGIN